MSDDYTFEGQLLTNMRRLKEILPCCPNCTHFTQLVIFGSDDGGGFPRTEREACGLDPERRRPPTRVIAFGCPAFEPNIPF